MTPEEKQIISSVLNTLTDVSYTALIETKKNNDATNEGIEYLEKCRRLLHDLIDELIIKK